MLRIKTLLLLITTTCMIPCYVCLGQNPYSFTQGGTQWEEVFDATPTPDSGWICAGTTYSFGNGSSDFYVIKFDANGTEQWKATYGTSALDKPTSIIPRSAGGYWLFGETTSNNAGLDWVLLQLDSAGAVVSTRTYGTPTTDYAASVLELDDGGVILTGSMNTDGNEGLQGSIIRLDAALNTVWQRAYHWGNDRVYQAIRTMDGGLALVGSTTSPFDESRQMLLWKLNSSGDMVWDFTCEVDGYPTQGMSVTEAPDSSLFVCGYYAHISGQDAGFLRKVDKDGFELWIQIYGGTNGVQFHDLHVSSDKHFHLAGVIKDTANSDRNLLYFELDSAGNMINTLSVGGTAEDGHEYSDNHVEILELDGGDFVLAGGSASFGAGSSDMYITKFNTLYIDSLCESFQPIILKGLAFTCWGGSGVSEDTLGSEGTATWSRATVSDLSDTLCGTAPAPPAPPVDTTDSTIGIHTSISQPDLHIYPNPALEYIQVSQSEKDVQQFWTAVSVLGQRFQLEGTQSDPAILDVRPLPTGTYFLLNQHGAVHGRFVKVSDP